MTHLIDNNEMNPHTECGLEINVGNGIGLALAHEEPTCTACVYVQKAKEEGVLNAIRWLQK